MDPNATLEEMRIIAAEIRDSSARVDSDDIDRLAELLLAMDEWLAGGGFMPSRWLKQQGKQE